MKCVKAAACALTCFVCVCVVVVVSLAYLKNCANRSLFFFQVLCCNWQETGMDLKTSLS